MAARGYSTRAVKAALESRPLNVTTFHDIYVPNENVGDFVSANELNPEVGDIIQYKCAFYYHWALYIGNGNILHLLSDGVVRQDPINYDPQSNWVCRVNNKVERARDLHLEMREFGETMSVAYGDLNKNVGYDPYYNNCEHRVMNWKYGYHFSDQTKAGVNVGKPLKRGIEGFAKGASTGIVLGSAAGLAAGGSFGCIIGAGIGTGIAFGASAGFSGYVSENRRQDVVREIMEEAYVNEVKN